MTAFLLSIIANCLKREISTVEDFASIISNSMHPSPSCQPLDYIWDWKSFITPNLYKVPISNHSSFHSFQIKKEVGFPRLRSKKYPQDSTYEPANGIILLNENIDYSPVPAADFRVEKLCLDVVFRDLNKFISRMANADGKRVQQSWANLREKLEKMPHRQKNLPCLKISELPKQRNDSTNFPVVPDLDEDDVPELQGEEFPAELNVGDFETEVMVGMDVVLWTESKLRRPWLGRVIEIVDSSCCILQWYGRRGRGNTFHALLNKGKAPFTSKQSFSSVMFWEMSTEKEETSFKLTNKWMEKIMLEYSAYDNIDEH